MATTPATQTRLSERTRRDRLRDAPRPDDMPRTTPEHIKLLIAEARTRARRTADGRAGELLRQLAVELQAAHRILWNLAGRVDTSTLIAAGTAALNDTDGKAVREAADPAGREAATYATLGDGASPQEGA